MKTIKFTPELSELIKQGKKTTTFRLFDDKNLQEGDKVLLATRDGEKVTNFANAILTEVYAKRIKDFTDEDYLGHEPVTNPVETYKKYYGEKVNEVTEVKIIRFKVLNSNHTSGV